MAAPKGTRPPNAGKGRPKGSTNKATAEVKDVLRKVHADMGGEKAMLSWAASNPTEFYKLWIKMLPTELSGLDGGPIVLEGIERRIVSGKHGS